MIKLRTVRCGTLGRRLVLPVAGGLALSGALVAAAQPSAGQSATSIAGFLHGVSALSASNAWAVGQRLAGTLIVHWNGTVWGRVSSPSPGSFPPSDQLNSVSMVSPTDGWAVGGYLGSGSAGFRFLVLHWNGTNWARLPSPAPGNGVLYGVHMVSAFNGWAVGEGVTSAGPRPVMLHWNGTAWKRVPVSFSGGIGVLAGVCAPSGSNAWAVGWTGGNPGVRTLVVHWNGTRWARVPSPNPGPDSDQLAGVSAISASDAWAVGVYYPRSGAAGQKKTLTLHWNGTAWKQVASPSPGRGDPKSNQANELAGVAALSSSNAWSVGDYTASTGQAALTLHWNGTKWAQAANQGGTPGARHLGGISMVSASDGWAVGGDEDAGKVIILRWNGSTWARS